MNCHLRHLRRAVQLDRPIQGLALHPPFASFAICKDSMF
jgi:hypothetical protein